MSKLKIIAIPFFVGIVLAGCSSPYEPINVKLYALSVPVSYYRNNLAADTSFRVDKVIDDRVDKTSLGIFDNHPVLLKNLSDWVKNSFMQMQKTCHMSKCQTLSITVKIKNAYIENTDGMINTNILIDVYYYRNGKFTNKIAYRGYDTSVAWLGSGSDYSSSLSSALKIILNKVASDVKRLQGSVKPKL